MKILIVNQHVSSVLGGSELHDDLLARKLVEYGHEVIYFAMNTSCYDKEDSYRVIPRREKRIGILSFSQLLKKEKPDIVYWGYNKKRLLLATLLCKYYRTKIIFRVNDINDVQKVNLNIRMFADFKLKTLIKFAFSLIHYMDERINYIAYKLLDGVSVCQKRFLDSILIKNMKYKICIYNSIESDFKNNFFWSSPFVVWVANLKKNKNPELFIKLAENIELKNIDFLMIGKIQDQQTYGYITGKKGLPPNFHFLGPKTPHEVNSILKSSLFLVHTCNPEGFGMNFIQAWFQKKPTITLYFDPDSVIEGENIGYFSRNFEQLLRDTRLLIKNSTLRNKMGDRAKIFAKKNFDLEKNVRMFEAFFQEVLSENKS